MSDEDALERVYEDRLLGMARRECEVLRTQGPFNPPGPRWIADGKATRDTLWTGSVVAPTLADALCALLRDLGVEPPERVSVEEVREAANFDYEAEPDKSTLDFLADLYARDEAGRLLAESIMAVGS